MPMSSNCSPIRRMKSRSKTEGGVDRTEGRTEPPPCPLSFARAVRAHWGGENRLHWVLDVVFRDDLARFRTGDGPQNMAIIRHTALNLLSRAKPTVSLKTRRNARGGM